MFIIDAMLAISDFIWGWPILILTFGAGIILSVKLKFFQFTKFGHAMKGTFGTIFEKSEGATGDISPFQACCTALASTLGVGNIAGVSVAIASGGPGAIFWMWVTAVLCLIVKFCEIILGVAYREKDPETGMWRGGLYWDVVNGLGKKWKWFGILWALVLGIDMLFAPAVQINTVVSSLNTVFTINPIIIGIFSAVLMAVVLIGGIKSISRFAELVVPFMAIAYTACSIYVLIRYAANIPGVLSNVVKCAFTPAAATGGFAGSTIMMAVRWGLARAVYSNEAGTGTAPLAHSTAAVNHPVKQGLWGITEVFVDTIVVCSMTALVVLCTGAWESGSTGAALTSQAFGTAFGNTTAGGIFIAIIIVFFAFTTAVVNVFYSEVCLNLVFGKKIIFPCRIAGCLMAIVGAVGALSTIWNLYDFFLGFCQIFNLIVCVVMIKKIVLLVNDYLKRLKDNKWEATSEEVTAQIPGLFAEDK